jgi:hypothetical protein
MKKINPNLYPSSGYMFKESDGSRIFGNTWPGVVARVVAYRKRNNLPPGNPGEEVNAQACQNNPGYCIEHNERARADAQKKHSSFKSQVLTWLNSITKIREKAWVPEETARNRAAVCATCPYNKPLPGGCASCKAAVAEFRKQILGSRFQDGRLNGCEILTEDLQVGVHLDQTTLDNGGLPGHCWRRRSV